MQNYAPNRNVITVGGVLITGWEEANFDFDEDEFSFEANAGDGEVTAIQNLNKIGTFSLVMKGTSKEQNTRLSALQIAKNPVSVTVLDLDNTTLLTMLSGILSKHAGFNKTKTPGNRTWPIKGSATIAG